MAKDKPAVDHVKAAVASDDTFFSDNLREEHDDATVTEVGVVVLKGKHVKHDGVEFKQNARLSLPADAAQHLINMGFVKTLDDVRREAQQAENREGATVEVEDGTSITQPGAQSGGEA